jgi:hypothetical protein
VDVVLAVLLVPVAGALGAALASVLAQGLASVLTVRAAVAVAGAAVPGAALARVLGAALLMGAVAAVPVVTLDGATGLAAAVAVGAAAYPLALRALRALTAEDLDRARVFVDRLPPRARVCGLGLAAFLCRRPEPWSPSR